MLIIIEGSSKEGDARIRRTGTEGGREGKSGDNRKAKRRVPQYGPYEQRERLGFHHLRPLRSHLPHTQLMLSLPTH